MFGRCATQEISTSRHRLTRRDVSPLCRLFRDSQTRCSHRCNGELATGSRPDLIRDTPMNLQASVSQHDVPADVRPSCRSRRSCRRQAEFRAFPRCALVRLHNRPRSRVGGRAMTRGEIKRFDARSMLHFSSRCGGSAEAQLLRASHLCRMSQ